ncbi:hypothetical protein AK812_SmicGene36015 [Symbiodinium microadriaticum]|uniref:Uncharacterized protein n=1 Tax=Symbiodinium microadriaticum TaxID=2951 RepID=A0A1Q9CJY6_SYMMI|nr:hypothetical protein AK812_SmicGene36015 [Symbiodinium microadriaticum]
MSCFRVADRSGARSAELAIAPLALGDSAESGAITAEVCASPRLPDLRIRLDDNDEGEQQAWKKFVAAWTDSNLPYSAHIVETNETVAIKKVFVDRRYRNRELQADLDGTGCFCVDSCGVQRGVA